jgi:hypothetical protein
VQLAGCGGAVLLEHLPRRAYVATQPLFIIARVEFALGSFGKTIEKLRRMIDLTGQVMAALGQIIYNDRGDA